MSSQLFNNSQRMQQGLKNYGGFETSSHYLEYDQANIVIVPVPYDGTSTWIKGADLGPKAILEASANMELYDIETDSEVYLKGIYTELPITVSSSPEAMSQAVETKVFDLLQDGKFPVVIGGEHSVSIGAFRAFARFYDTISILQLDAHSDLRTLYEGSSHNHACVMARAKEVASITQVGIRSMCAEEKEQIDKRDVFFAHDLYDDEEWMESVTNQLKNNVYITIDLDVFDPSIMPSTGTPEPDGLSYREVIDLLKMVSAKRDIIGFDVVELCPNKWNKAPDFLASKLIYQLLSMKFHD